MRPDTITCAELEAALALVPDITVQAQAFEDARQLSPEIVQRMTDAGLIDMAVPAVYGGRENTPMEIMRVNEAISYADGSTGWVLMNYQGTAAVSAFLPSDWGAEVFGASERCCPAGALHPRGRGRFVDGGMIVNGRWGWVSGCDTANWMWAGTTMLDDDGTPLENSDGTPLILGPLFSRDQLIIHDTWYVAGMCGSGSNDVEVQDAFVPEGRWVNLAEPPVVDRPLFHFPIISLFAAGVAAVALGSAQAALDGFIDLARDRIPFARTTPLAERTSAQISAARAEALIDSARNYLYETTADLWELNERGNEPTVEARRRLRLAGAYAAEKAAEAVDLLYAAGGGPSLVSDRPFQRHWRDVHATTLHIQVNHVQFETMGKLRLTGESSGLL